MIWFTCPGRNVIGVLNNYTGDVTEHRSIPTDNSQPRGIAFDPITGNVWFTEYAGHKITKYVPSDNLFYEYPTLTGGSAPFDIAIQWNNSTAVNVWFTEFGANNIGQISQGRPGTAATTYGTTFTTTVTTLTSAVSATFTAGSSTTIDSNRPIRSSHYRIPYVRPRLPFTNWLGQLQLPPLGQRLLTSFQHQHMEPLQVT